MNMADGDASASFLASQWSATGTSNTAVTGLPVDIPASMPGAPLALQTLRRLHPGMTWYNMYDL